MQEDKEKLIFRLTEKNDEKYLKQWLLDPEIKPFFPMTTEEEVDDSVQRWIGFSKFGCSLTAVYEGNPCGIATLYLQGYKKLVHQTEFGIIVSKEYRKKGVGSKLLEEIMKMAKEKFKIELIHLQVFDQNPAIKLYKRYGFKEFGRQSQWIKDQGIYGGRVFMERKI